MALITIKRKGRNEMLAEKAMEIIRSSPHMPKMGMILTHLGIVRSTSRDGKEVKEVEVVFDQGKVDEIKKDMLLRPGIYEVVILTNPGILKVGDEIMAVAVGGDIRENVFPVLMETVNRIKKEASRKLEM